MQGSLLLNGRVETTKLKDPKIEKIKTLRIENLFENKIHSLKSKWSLNIDVYSWKNGFNFGVIFKISYKLHQMGGAKLPVTNKTNQDASKRVGALENPLKSVLYKFFLHSQL